MSKIVNPTYSGELRAVMVFAQNSVYYSCSTGASVLSAPIDDQRAGCLSQTF
jgi:hypothetical protein